MYQWWRREGASFYSSTDHMHAARTDRSLPKVDYTKKPRRPTQRYSVALPKKKSSVYEQYFSGSPSEEATSKRDSKAPIMPYSHEPSLLRPVEERKRLDSDLNIPDGDVPIPGPTPHVDLSFDQQPQGGL